MILIDVLNQQKLSRLMPDITTIAGGLPLFAPPPSSLPDATPTYWSATQVKNTLFLFCDKFLAHRLIIKKGGSRRFYAKFCASLLACKTEILCDNFRSKLLVSQMSGNRILLPTHWSATQAETDIIRVHLFVSNSVKIWLSFVVNSVPK
jgi:hypothetical protein